MNKLRPSSNFTSLASPWSFLISTTYSPLHTVASLPACKALATGSLAIAQSRGLQDDDLDLEANLKAVGDIAEVAAATNKFLTVDFQDGYGEKLEEGVARLIELGAVGLNIEDSERRTHKMVPVPEFTARIKRAC